MTARIAVATALSSATSSSDVRALKGCLITNLLLSKPGLSAETDGNITLAFRNGSRSEQRLRFSTSGSNWRKEPGARAFFCPAYPSQTPVNYLLWAQTGKVTLKHEPRPAGLGRATKEPLSCLARIPITFIPSPVRDVSGLKPGGRPFPRSQTRSERWPASPR